MLIRNSTLQNGRYRIVRHIGQGGMGTVYEVVDNRLNSRVALKQSLVNNNPRLRQAFETEAKLLGQLWHPALVRVTDHFQENGEQYFVMEFVPGDDLAEQMKQHKLFGVQQVLEWAEQLLDALQYLHTQTPSIIHRDIKPSNLKLAPNGKIVLLDFGIAKGGQLHTQLSSIRSYSKHYSPMEQHQGAGTNERSDLYALGATLYHLFSGEPPPDALERANAMANRRSDPLQPIHILVPAVSKEVSQALSKAMAFNAIDRPANAQEMRTLMFPDVQSDLSEGSWVSPWSVLVSIVIGILSGYAPLPDVLQDWVWPLLLPFILLQIVLVLIEQQKLRMSRWRWSVLGLLLVMVGIGVRLAIMSDENGEEANRSTATVEEIAVIDSQTPTPTATSEPSPTPTATSEPSPTPTLAIPLLAGTPLPQSLTVISAENASKLREIARLGKEELTGEVAYSPDGKLLAVGSSIGIYLYDAETLQEVRFLDSQESINTIVFSPDGTLLAAGSRENSIQLWQVSDGQLLASLEGHTDDVSSMSFSPDGEWLASASSDDTVRLWRVSDGQLLASLEGYTDDVSSVSFSPDGERLASASSDDTVRLWQVSDGQLLASLKGHTSDVRSVSFSPDGERLASGSHDRTVRLWKIPDGQLLANLEGHTRSVTSVSFSPDGERLASGSWDETVRLWSVSDGQLLATLDGHTDSVRSVSFSPDGRLLTSGSYDGTIRLWGVVGE